MAMRLPLAAAAAAMALAIAAGPAPAALIVTVEDFVVAPSPVDQTEFIEVFFQEDHPAADEQLIAYSIKLDFVGAATPTGPRFVSPPLTPTDHPYVFPSGSPTDFDSTFN